MASAIQTKFLGPTNARGSRVKAETADKNPSTGRKDSVTVSWDHRLNADENHIAAAKALAAKLDWAGDWTSGGTETGMVFIRAINDGGFTI